jgi:hypothetical protein
MIQSGQRLGVLGAREERDLQGVLTSEVRQTFYWSMK